ncbi:MAG: prefoldin subunit [Candidatus Thermoplasmatota archaeon]|nr:prefoldin subunit [Candidatus Thermoplasmatota archaeon]
MSEKVSTEEIQSLARELQLVRNQIQTVSSQISEYGITIEALENQDPDRPVFRSLGNILLEVEDRNSLSSELEEAKNSLEEHLNRLIEREDNLREHYEDKASLFESG